MKFLFCFAFCFCLSSTLSADEELPSVKESMMKMGQQFGKIAIALSQGSINSDQLTAIEELQFHASHATVVFPETADTETKQVSYLSLMSELNRQSLLMEIEMEKVIAADETPQNLDKTREIFTKMDELQRKGHEEFQN